MNRIEITNELLQFIQPVHVKFDEPMSWHTTFKVGGPADIFITTPTFKSLAKVLDFCSNNNIPFFVLGNGSNLVVSDKGIRGIVISTLKHIHASYSDNFMSVSSGLELKKVCLSAAQRGLTGLEFACGIPGTVGGAVYMNAGAYDGEIGNVVSTIEVLSPTLDKYSKIRYTWSAYYGNSLKFSYRHSNLQDSKDVLLTTIFKLRYENKRIIKKRMLEYTKLRVAKQPLEMPSAGSVFRRPEGFYTGQLIQECGLKGFRIGDAAISEKHCGFIVNLGNATATDIKNLVNHIQETVDKKFGVMLQTEIKFVGEIRN